MVETENQKLGEELKITQASHILSPPASSGEPLNEECDSVMENSVASQPIQSGKVEPMEH
jgi:hypothetical protein